MKLSVIVPVYNEKATIIEIIERIRKVNYDKEIIVIDDCSTDGTREILQGMNYPELKVIYHTKNKGKGGAIRTGIKEATGDMIIIQDADLEYYPEEYPLLIKLIEENKADVVYGSRFLGTHRVFLFWHYVANKFLTFLTNFLYNTTLTDMETCFKLFRASVIKNIEIKSNGFDFEPEITAKVFKNKKNRVYEVPISYSGRSYEEGKKITWKDAFIAIYALLKYRIMD